MTHGFVYFIVPLDDESIVKIGWAKDPQRRVTELQTGNALALSVRGTIPGTVKDEQHLHRRFATCRLRGEWFRIEGELAAFIAEMPQTIERPEEPEVEDVAPTEEQEEQAEPAKDGTLDAAEPALALSKSLKQSYGAERALVEALAGLISGSPIDTVVVTRRDCAEIVDAPGLPPPSKQDWREWNEGSQLFEAFAGAAFAGRNTRVFNKQEALVLVARFADAYTREEIAEELEMAWAEVRLIEARAISKLRVWRKSAAA